MVSCILLSSGFLWGQTEENFEWNLTPEIVFDYDMDDNGAVETTGSLLLKNFTLQEPSSGTLSFDYHFLTSEGGSVDSPPFRDVFSVNLYEVEQTTDGSLERTESAPRELFGGAVDYGADTNESSYSGTFEPHDFTNGGDFPGTWHASFSDPNFFSDYFFTEGAVSNNLSFNMEVPAGMYELEFRVANSGDSFVQSALAIDNVVLTSGDEVIAQDFENGFGDWFYVGEAGIFTNALGDNPIFNENMRLDGENLDQFTFLPAPGDSTGDFPNSFAFLTTPEIEAIPEPSTYLMFGLGILAISGWFYRCRLK